MYQNRLIVLEMSEMHFFSEPQLHTTSKYLKERWQPALGAWGGGWTFKCFHFELTTFSGEPTFYLTSNARVQCPNQEDRIDSPVTYHWGHGNSCLVFCTLSFRWCSSPSAGIPQKLLNEIQRVMNDADRVVCEVPRGEYVSAPPPPTPPTHPHIHTHIHSQTHLLVD